MPRKACGEGSADFCAIVRRESNCAWRVFPGVGKDPFNGLFPPLAEFLVLGRIAGIVGQLPIVLPDMPPHGLYAVLGAGHRWRVRQLEQSLGALLYSRYPSRLEVR